MTEPAPRPCSDCGTDISHRARQARRCRRCAYVEKHRPRTPGPRSCATCFTDLGPRVNAKRCRPCAAAAILAAKQAAYANVAARPYACRHCGTEFLRRRTDTHYCRHRCWQLAQVAAARNARPPNICGWCSAEFRPVRSNAVYCRAVCNQAAAYAADPEARKAAAAAWLAANPERRRAIAAADKARRRAAPGPGIRSRDWLRLLRRHCGRCAYCGTAGPLHMDHVVPIVRGGQHAIGNVLPACAGCNLSKHAALLVEWRRRRARAASVPRQRTTQLPAREIAMS